MYFEVGDGVPGEPPDLQDLLGGPHHPRQDVQRGCHSCRVLILGILVKDY